MRQGGKHNTTHRIVAASLPEEPHHLCRGNRRPEVSSLEEPPACASKSVVSTISSVERLGDLVVATTAGDPVGAVAEGEGGGSVDIIDYVGELAGAA
ncbi:hypothetical protein E2542_SST14236 [Spatholobus suberectus]|nr:hypothetical protein E2542_SST14236 [Spatholobus suberectus]